MSRDLIKVERDGWFIDIENLDVDRRPGLEIRVLISRKNERVREQRTHRFYVSPEVDERFALEKLPDAKLDEMLMQGVKRVVLRELDEIFQEPEDGLDSVRPLGESDLNS